MPDYRKVSVHCHTTFCDGKFTPEQMAAAACAQGLELLGLSGHSHTDCDASCCMTAEGTEAYRAELARLKAAYKGRLDILCGLEWDQFSDDDPHRYDYWIGSVHYLCGPRTGRYYAVDNTAQELRECIDTEFDGDGLAAAEAYFRSVAETAARRPTILGHFDLIKKLNADSALFDENAPRYRAAALAALEAAAENGCVLEVNTGGVYRGYRQDFYPADWQLTAWQKMGGQVTITADAHTTESLTFGFEKAAQQVRAAGFAAVQVLTAEGFVPQEL